MGTTRVKELVKRKQMQSDELPVREMTLDEEQLMTGVFAISLVQEPAIEEGWVALSGQKVEFAAEEDRRMLFGPALIPDKLIYRRQGKDEYYVTIKSDTIAKTQELFFKTGNQNKTTVEHAMALPNNCVVESWIVEDPEKDKQALFGMKHPKGTWMVGMKVEDEAAWNLAKEGVLVGFSIEGWYDNVPIEQSKKPVQVKAKVLRLKK